MKQILIDLSTLRKNDFAGFTNAMVQGLPRVITVYGHGEVPEILQNPEFATVINKNTCVSDTLKSTWECVLHDDNLDEIYKLPNLLSISYKTYNTGIRYVTPEPDYLYHYENCEVECSNCKSTFDYKELEETDNDEIGYSNKVCPVCKHFDCVDIEYETVEEALRRENV